MRQVCLGNERCYDIRFYPMIMKGIKKSGLSIASNDRSDPSNLYIFNGLGLDANTLLYANRERSNSIFFERNPFYFREEDSPQSFFQLYRVCFNSLCYRASYPYCFPTERGRFREMQRLHKLRQPIPWHLNQNGRIYVFLNYNEGFWSRRLRQEDFTSSYSDADTPWRIASSKMVDAVLANSTRDIVIKWHPLTNMGREDAKCILQTYAHHDKVSFSSKDDLFKDIEKDMFCSVCYAGSSCFQLCLLGIPSIIISDHRCPSWYDHVTHITVDDLAREDTMLDSLPDQEECLDFLASQTFSMNEISNGSFFCKYLAYHRGIVLGKQNGL